MWAPLRSHTLVGIAWGTGAFVLLGDAGGCTWTWSIDDVPLIFAPGVVVSLVGRARPQAGHPHTCGPFPASLRKAHLVRCGESGHERRCADTCGGGNARHP